LSLLGLARTVELVDEVCIVVGCGVLTLKLLVASLELRNCGLRMQEHPFQASPIFFLVLQLPLQLHNTRR
jgi:hypothetical protein